MREPMDGKQNLDWIFAISIVRRCCFESERNSLMTQNFYTFIFFVSGLATYHLELDKIDYD